MYIYSEPKEYTEKGLKTFNPSRPEFTPDKRKQKPAKYITPGLKFCSRVGRNNATPICQDKHTEKRKTGFVAYKYFGKLVCVLRKCFLMEFNFVRKHWRY